tara:strand:- start:132 stop:638 length:507 start_codon:yes stop_codon:yes gene_type:complete
MEIGVLGELQVIDYLEKELSYENYIPMKDRGIDLISVKKNNFYYIQVKTSKFQKGSYFWFDLILEKMIYSKNTIYIFNCFVNERRTFMGKKRNLLVIPSNDIKNWINKKQIHITTKKKSSGNGTNKAIRFFVYPDFKNKKWIYKGNSKIKEKLIDLTKYWNNKKVFKS